ncbi:MAG: helix-turn-helix domain-containing protein [Clostridiales bacterium]|nr:helix-turn-helix domain-containing protein [Clostridiales bacterium]
MEMSLQRMADLERRVMALEERTRRSLWTQEAALACKEEELLGRYGEYVDKTVTAKILGVTRATVYAMLADGRIEGACAGRRVSVRSIAHYMAAPKSRGRQRKSELCPQANQLAM